jgi:hypothetical protein
MYTFISRSGMHDHFSYGLTENHLRNEGATLYGLRD